VTPTSRLFVHYATRGLAAGVVLGFAAGLALSLARRHKDEPCSVCGGRWAKP
jgi:hypothetical protein